MLSFYSSGAFLLVFSLRSCIFIYFIFTTQTRILSICARFAHWSCWSGYVHVMSNERYNLCIITCSFNSIPYFSIHFRDVFRWCTSNSIWYISDQLTKMSNLMSSLRKKGENELNAVIIVPKIKKYIISNTNIRPRSRSFNFRAEKLTD